jgi:hypothetical protein
MFGVFVVVFLIGHQSTVSIALNAEALPVHLETKGVGRKFRN